MTSPELLLASLGSCAGFYAARYLKKHHLAAGGTIVRVSAEKDTNPPQMNNFRIRVEIPLGISDQHREEIEQAVGHCLIHNALLNSPGMSMEIKHLALQAV